MKATENTAAESLPIGAPADPDFNDDLPGIDPIRGPLSSDPDQTDFRDKVHVTNYHTVGGLRAELEDERMLAEQATLDVLHAMRAMDAGDQVKWRISRSGHENDELNGYLETWPNHQMTIERLRDRFGGGTYYCKGFRKGKYCSHETLQISGEAKRKPSGVEGVNQSLPVAAGPQFDMQGFLMAQERREEKRREQERQERLEREERDEKRRSERMQVMLTLGPAALTALGGLFQGRQVDYVPLIAAMKGPDPLTMLAQLKALQGNQGQDGMLNKILPMLIEMAGSRASGGDTGWLDIIKEFAKGAGPAVGGLIEANLKAATLGNIPTPLPTHAAPNSALTAPPSATPNGNIPLLPSSAAPSATPSGIIVVPESVPRRERRARSVSASLPVEHGDSANPTVDGFATTVGARSPTPRGAEGGAMNPFTLMAHRPWLCEQLQRMLMAASRGRDPEVYAALLMEELPEGLAPQVIGELLSHADWFQFVCQMEPHWNDGRVVPWLEQVRALILESLTPRAARTPTPQVRGAADAQAGVATQTPPAPKPRGQGPVERPLQLPSLTGE